jgi:hypothetical protein
VRDAIKGHLDYLEWLGQSLDDSEKEAHEAGWLTTSDLRRTLATDSGRRTRGRSRSR